MDGRFIKYKKLIYGLIKEKSYKRKDFESDLENIIPSQKEKKDKYQKDWLYFNLI